GGPLGLRYGAERSHRESTLQTRTRRLHHTSRGSGRVLFLVGTVFRPLRSVHVLERQLGETAHCSERSTATQSKGSFLRGKRGRSDSQVRSPGSSGHRACIEACARVGRRTAPAGNGARPRLAATRSRDE